MRSASHAQERSQRHKWTPLRKTYGSNESVCERCKLEKIGRFDRGHHWTEWKRDGKYIESERTPPCQMTRTQADEILRSAAKDIRDGFTYDPGHSDLDNEQPIHVRTTLGTWRRINLALAILEGEPK